MASTLKELKAKHETLVREAVRVIGHLQMLMDDDATPEHVKPRLSVCLELLDKGLLGQDMEDKRVLIEVLGGVAYVAEKSEYVQVVIHDLDNAFEG